MPEDTSVIYVVMVRSESGDTFLLGPWPHPPSHEQVVESFLIVNEEEARYCEELEYSYVSYPMRLGDRGLCCESTVPIPCEKALSPADGE